ncbi:GNAT family N-acetyltransferase, partial [Enterobacter hormaechei]|uniref:GNAT family N-acetyltransferase n=1 Tax=Enterobacter hormaechei TaxID=158836 RepID=UPI001F0A1F72
MEIDKFTIIQRDNTTIACAALYPFPEEKIGEMACVAVHPDYRSSSRGEVLLERIAAQAMEIDKFTIIQRDNTTIACAALYPFPEEKIGEMA